MYLETEQFKYEPRKQKPKFVCPTGFSKEYQQFLEELKYRGNSNRTISDNRDKVQAFLKYLESIDVYNSGHITLAHVEGFLLLYKKNAVKYIVTGFISKNLSLDIPKIRVPRNGAVPYSWKKEDVLKLLNAVDRCNPKGKRDYAIFLMVVRLGLRIGDIRNLKLSNLNWESKTINLVMSKTQQHLELPLLDDIGWAIIDYLKNGRPETISNCLFVRHRPPFNSFGETESFHNALKRYMLKAGLNTSISPRHGMHSLRSTLAKNMLEADAPLPVISETLGHQDINTTGIYLKIDIDGLRKCALDPEEVFL